jgi:hypothetical protein
VYRVKGVATTGTGEDQRGHLVNVTCGRVNLDLAPAPLARIGRTSLVVIGRGVVTKHRRAIEDLLFRQITSAADSRPGRRGLGRLLPRGRG